MLRVLAPARLVLNCHWPASDGVEGAAQTYCAPDNQPAAKYTSDLTCTVRCHRCTWWHLLHFQTLSKSRGQRLATQSRRQVTCRTSSSAKTLKNARTNIT